MAITQRRMTLEEFLRLPEEEPYLELIDGMVMQKVAPQWLHSVLQPNLAAIINHHARPRKLAIAATELRATVGPDSLVPDVAVYRWERIPRGEDGKLLNFLPGTPDIAIEIVSPDQTVREMVAKCRRYLANGAQVALAVDPDSETVVRVHPDGSTMTLRGDDRLDLSPVLPDFELTIRNLFDALRVD